MGKRGLIMLGILWVLVLGVLPGWAYHLPDTGQTTCYDDVGNLITCPSPGQPFYGQDAQYAGPQPSYKDNGNGTVTDLNTGLMWQQGDNQNIGAGLSWQRACDYCAALDPSPGGYSDWRLPDGHELISICLYGRYDPSINITYFPDCLSDDYWSGTEKAGVPESAWFAYFTSGNTSYGFKESSRYVRCVRAPKLTPSLQDNGNGTVTDMVTGLMWQQLDDQNEEGYRSWEESLNYCESLTFPSGGYSDWRLPNIRELESLVDLAARFPAISPLFLDCRNDYWSSTTDALSRQNAWAVDFVNGIVESSGKSSDGCVRCVRGGVALSLYVDRYGGCGGYLPCYSSIQAAINAAANGDTILVSHGDYYETIVLDQEKSLKLLCGRGDDFGPSTMFSTICDLLIRRGSLIVEGLHLVGE